MMKGDIHIYIQISINLVFKLQLLCRTKCPHKGFSLKNGVDVVKLLFTLKFFIWLSGWIFIGAELCKCVPGVVFILLFSEEKPLLPEDL